MNGMTNELEKLIEFHKRLQQEQLEYFIEQLPTISGIYDRMMMGDTPILDTTEKVGKYAITLFYSKMAEELYLISLSSSKRLISYDQISRGDPNSAPAPIRLIMETVISSNAHSVVLAHNHPSGELEPSINDIDVTTKVANALKTIDVKLHDHIIVSRKKYVSMKKIGIIWGL
ncbi:MAG: JAB domain-containing protein [Oscillospiraceae bacterium]|nr:JAB domain-containing protein [Oscillospiraceae bacterium]